mmetsp:Transcript_84591/g.220369  ORF Transcript_84591/g.220369 Transcript_84591/m.220369 type:complete len:206 (-) Transcript_84591:102-719(-)
MPWPLQLPKSTERPPFRLGLPGSQPALGARRSPADKARRRGWPRGQRAASASRARRRGRRRYWQARARRCVSGASRRTCNTSSAADPDPPPPGRHPAPSKAGQRQRPRHRAAFGNPVQMRGIHRSCIADGVARKAQSPRQVDRQCSQRCCNLRSAVCRRRWRCIGHSRRGTPSALGIALDGRRGRGAGTPRPSTKWSTGPHARRP